ncbi:kinase-like protein, partial [Bimuria novae-zelandiae CBS 107.79]
GRGQHVEFGNAGRDDINAILKVRDRLGSTGSAIVQSVRCKRILLARKTVHCNRHLTTEKAIDEVAHLSRLSHSHVVRVIGTYTIRNELSILIFLVAEWDLKQFLDREVQPTHIGDPSYNDTFSSLTRFLICIANAMEYIHSNMTKYMDIKPRNLLVRRRRIRTEEDIALARYKIYVADFGIARSYTSLEVAETEGPTSFNRKYAATEVVDREKRGLTADIFFMGCVFIEIFTSILEHLEPKEGSVVVERGCQVSNHREHLRILLRDNEYGDTSYQANLPALYTYISGLASGFDLDTLRVSLAFSSGLLYSDFLKMAKQMVDKDPTRRPSAEALVLDLGSGPCCERLSDALEAEEKSGN